MSIEPEQPIHRDDLRCVVKSPPIGLPDVLSTEWGVEPPGGNILLVLLDDVGVDKIGFARDSLAYS